MRIELKTGRPITIDNDSRLALKRTVKQIDRDLFTADGRRYKRYRYHNGSSYMNTQSGWTISLLDDAIIRCGHPAYPNGISSSEFYAVLPDGEPQRRNSYEEPFENVVERLDRQLFG